MKVLTWNMQGFKTNYGWLQQFHSQYDVILLQETWLFSFESNLIENSFRNYRCICASSMPDSKNGLRGRPYGGTAILIKKQFESCIIEIDTSDPRVLCVLLQTAKGKLLITNVYLPCNSPENDNLITEYYGKIECRIRSHDCEVLVMGDFNVSPAVNKFQELQILCEDLDLNIEDIEKLDTNTFTFCSKGSGSTSWIDHCVASQQLVSAVKLPFSCSPSDHIPMETVISSTFNSRNQDTTPKRSCEKIKWNFVTQAQKNTYSQRVLNQLCNYDWYLCCEENCTNLNHRLIIDQKVELLVSILESCSKFLIKSKNKWSSKQEYGWNDLVKEHFEAYRSAYKD